MKKISIIIILVISIVSLFYCEEDSSSPVEPSNKPPSITSIIATPDSLNPGESSTVVCLTNDPDGDSLDFSWSTSNGIINGTGAIVEWMSPNYNGDQTVTCIINDNNGGLDSLTISINVFNSQPIINSIQSANDSIKIGSTIQITCTAGDQDGDSLTYTWSSIEGIISGSGDSIDWTAPLITGIYSILCKVEDGNGGIDSSEIDITVVLLPISTQGLIGYWPIIGDANDESGYGNDGLVLGAGLTEDRNGKTNSAYLFDGINDYVDIGNNATLKPPLPISISMWIEYRNPVNGSPFTSNIHETNYYGIHVGFILLDNRINIQYGDGGAFGSSSRRTKSVTRPIPDTWFHYVGIIRSSTDMDIYVNGVNVGGTYTGSGGPLAYDNGNINIGRLDTDQTGPPRYFNGKLDEIIMFNWALSEQEVQKLYHSNW